MTRSAAALGATMLALALAAGPARAAPATQTIEDSAASGQVGSVQVDAPVRVASDGDNSPPSATVSGGDQTTSDSTGSAQAGSAQVNAPVRVLSDGENASSGGGPPGTGAQAEPDPTDDSAPTESQGEPESPGNTQFLGEEDPSSADPPASDVLSGGSGGEGGGETVPTGTVRTLGEGSLPVTGLGLLAMFLLGLVLMGNGLALRAAGREPR